MYIGMNHTGAEAEKVRVSLVPRSIKGGACLGPTTNQGY